MNLAYDDASRRTSLTYPNGVVTSYGYDNANRLLTMNHVKNPTTIEALTYQYDVSSNRISLNRANAAASVIPTAVSSNSYDAANQQTQFNGVTQTFDANGNLTNDGTNTYSWDARNRLTAISGGVTASFVYDGLGRRKSKTISSTTTGFWYDGSDVLAELSGSTPTATYIRSLSIDEPFVRKLSGGDEFYEADALGSSVALTNSAGVSQTMYTYETFGATTHSGTASTNPFQFTGRENDGTGLYYFRMRHYQSSMRRFISEDPMRYEGSNTNLYAYVRNSVVNFRDPTGLKEFADDFVGPLPQNGYRTLQMMETRCGRIPPSPSNVDIDQNMIDAKGRWSPWWFRDQVTSKGPWDFKRIDLLYEDFGNFHYGATGRAFGFSTSVLLREAGRYQVERGTSRPEWGDPGWRFNPWGGVPPYGDDPSDQEWIRKGIRYSKCVAQ